MPKSPKFDYRLVTNDETRAAAAKAVRQEAARFLAWRAERPQRRALDLPNAFGAWWLQKGPVRFAATDDALRFKREVLRAAAALAGEA